MFFDERGWVQVLPDPDEPIVHVYAEGETSDELATSSRPSSQAIVADVLEREEIAARS